MESEITKPIINTAVFIDYENVHKSLLQEHTNIPHLAFIEKLRKYCTESSRRIVKIVAYCNFDITDLYESYHQSLLQSYGVETVHTSNQGKNYADLKITIDVLNSIHADNNIDEFLIMSNDKDMIPLINEIRINKRNVAIITTGTSYNSSICEFADSHIKLEDICKLDVEHKIIDDIADIYWGKFNSYVSSQIANYPGTRKFVPSEFKYVISNEFPRTKIMGYELASIIKHLSDEKKVFFYKYEHYGKPYYAFAPTDTKVSLISLGILAETDIVVFDIEKEIDTLYVRAIGST